MIRAIVKWWKKCQHRRKWPIEIQVQRARICIQQDERWLAEDPVAAAIVARYKDLLAPDWEKRWHEPVEDFRARLRTMRAAEQAEVKP